MIQLNISLNIQEFQIFDLNMPVYITFYVIYKAEKSTKK